jgi:hypothetical protein
LRRYRRSTNADLAVDFRSMRTQAVLEKAGAEVVDGYAYAQVADRSPAAGMRSRFTRSASPGFCRDALCERRYVSSAAVAVCASSNSANLSAVTGLLK